MSEGVGYDIVDFIKGVEANKLTNDDFINFNTLPRDKLKAFREEMIPACSTEELTKFTTNLFSAHIDRAFSEGLDAFEAPVLIREQSQLYLLVNTCMKEIGKRYLELQDSPEKFGTVKIDPAILACYSNYSDRLTESILKMPEENIRHMLSEDIAKIIKNQNLKAGNEVASNAMENLLEKLFTRDDVLKSNIRSALVGLPNSNEKDLIEQVNEVLANYDVDNNRKEIADYIANRNIAYSISFVMYKNMLEMPSEVMSHEAGDILAKHIELAKPYGQYVMALRTQDLTSQIPLKEAILSHVQGNDSIQENSELLKMAQQIDTSKSQNNQQENVSVLKYVETVLIEFIAKVKESCVNISAKANIELEKSLSSIYDTLKQIRDCFLRHDDVGKDHSEDIAVHYTKADESIKIMKGQLREETIAMLEEQVRAVIKNVPSEHRKDLIMLHGTVMSELQTLHAKQERDHEKENQDKGHSWQERTEIASRTTNRGVSR
ncbi:hypothetical protein [Candidatus Lariskella endosymbiont of Epinotia ramella]|uniref:hypothetical protein n=1 Tax=Candidatus Lariskella endosymbiont of Epinotia ramella TaxID=3066224 RepID=UPI0030D37FA6